MVTVMRSVSLELAGAVIHRDDDGVGLLRPVVVQRIALVIN